jgi:hypothetical protein
MNPLLCSAVLTAALLGAAAQVEADDAASPPKLTKHQMMKDCMAKQKASDSGMPKEQMKKNCRDVTNTEKENEKAEKAAADPSRSTRT